MWVGPGAQLGGEMSEESAAAKSRGNTHVTEPSRCPWPEGLVRVGRRAIRTQLRRLLKETECSRRCLSDIFYIEPLFLAALHPTHLC